jgi:hypothetical protein
MADEFARTELAVESACTRFEAAWKEGRKPRIEEFLGGLSVDDRSPRTRELLLQLAIIDLQRRNTFSASRWGTGLGPGVPWRQLVRRRGGLPVGVPPRDRPDEPRGRRRVPACPESVRRYAGAGSGQVSGAIGRRHGGSGAIGARPELPEPDGGAAGEREPSRRRVCQARR